MASHVLDRLAQHQLLDRVVLLLPDPSELAAACRTAAAALNEDALLLEWAQEQLAPRFASSTNHRHPGYALLHWPRLRSMATPRLAKLLLKWVQRQQAALEPSVQSGSGNSSSASSNSSLGSDSSSISRAQQLLDSGDALAALKALLPHSKDLLLLYAAHAGHTGLISDLLASGLETQVAKLKWGDAAAVERDLAMPAVRAAIRGGKAGALRLLLPAAEPAMGDPEKRSWWKGRLLRDAVASNAQSSACLDMLLQWAICGNCGKADVSSDMLEEAARCGNAGAVQALLTAGVGGHLDSYCQAAGYVYALKHGHLHLLPLLAPGDLSVGEWATYVCASAESHIRSGSVERLAMLEAAVWQLKVHPAGEDCWSYALTAAVRCNSLPVVRTIWEACIEPVEGSEYQEVVATDVAALFVTLSALLREEPLPGGLDALQWLLANLPGKGQPGTLHMLAAYVAARNGHLDIAQALQQQAGTIGANPGEWLSAQRQGQLLSAVRRGDAAGVQAALATLQLQDIRQGEVMTGAFKAAAALEDFCAAEVRLLAPWIDHEDVMPGVVASVVMSAHGGALLRMLCEASEEVRGWVAGSWSAHTFCVEACDCGDMALAQWLVCRPEQRLST